MRSPLTIETHARLRLALIQAERLAAFTLTTIRGRTAEAVAVEVASRVIHNLRSKTQPEGSPRP
jgi:hypothetical protein